MADDQIAVLFERTMYHMSLGVHDAVRGKEEYIITVPSGLPKGKLQETITVVMQSLGLLAVEHNDSELRPNDTWAVRLIPLRFPMLAYPTKDGDAITTEPPPVSEEEAAAAKEYFAAVPDAGSVNIMEYPARVALTKAADVFDQYAHDNRVHADRFTMASWGKKELEIRSEVWAEAAKQLRLIGNSLYAAEDFRRHAENDE